MKIRINDGCANGGMMDSLSIRPDEGGDDSYGTLVDVTDEEWSRWQEFLKLHEHWEVFWDRGLRF